MKQNDIQRIDDDRLTEAAGGMRLRYTPNGLTALDNMNRHAQKLAQSTERVRTGVKLDLTKDDPTNAAIAKRMNEELNRLSKQKDIGE